MPNIDDLLKQTERRGGPGSDPQFEVPRDRARRPWNGLEIDLEPDSSERPGTHSENSKITEGSTRAEAWYDSAVGIIESLHRNALALTVIFVLTTALTTGIATQVPSSYFSTLHLYAPEKTDSVASRLQLFSNKIEFASFPVDFKIPLGLIARRLNSEIAKHWVVEQYLSRSTHATSVAIDPNFVTAETFYAEGSELLVIQGYANDPEISVEVTNLYWEYLEKEIKDLKQDNLEKVHHWIELTSADWNDRLASISNRISDMPAESYQDRGDALRNQLASEQSDTQLKLAKLKKEAALLKSASHSDDPALLWSVPDQEIQDLRRVDDVLKAQDAQQSQRRSEVFQRARDLIGSKLNEKNVEISALTDRLHQVSSQFMDHTLAIKNRSSLSAKQQDLIRQQSDYVGRLEELEKLKNQIDVESALAHTKLRAIKAPVADESSRRPNLMVKYTVAIFAALFLTICALLFMEKIRSIRLKRAAT